VSCDAMVNLFIIYLQLMMTYEQVYGSESSGERQRWHQKMIASIVVAVKGKENKRSLIVFYATGRQRVYGRYEFQVYVASCPTGDIKCMNCKDANSTRR